MPPGLAGDIDLRTHAHEPGRVLTRWGDPGLAEMVKEGRDGDGRFAGEVVDAAVALITSWGPVPEPTWVACVPSHGGQPLVQDLAVRIAEGLGLPFVDAVRQVAVDHRPQATMQNSHQQATNALGAFAVERVPEGPVLLIDDLVDSRWTLAVVAGRLRAAGSGPVYPVVLADISRGGG
jgi:ATP-dependent DNA helicase RecQ